jgi:hypothetical protein
MVDPVLRQKSTVIPCLEDTGVLQKNGAIENGKGVIEWHIKERTSYGQLENAARIFDFDGGGDGSAGVGCA